MLMGLREREAVMFLSFSWLDFNLALLLMQKRGHKGSIVETRSVPLLFSSCLMGCDYRRHCVYCDIKLGKRTF